MTSAASAPSGSAMPASWRKYRAKVIAQTAIPPVWITTRSAHP